MTIAGPIIYHSARRLRNEAPDAVAALLLMATPAYAVKPSEELSRRLTPKLQAKACRAYNLEIVANEEVKDQKVVGSCEGKQEDRLQAGEIIVG